MDLSSVSLTQHHSPRVLPPGKTKLSAASSASSRLDIDHILSLGEIPSFGSRNLGTCRNVNAPDQKACLGDRKRELPSFGGRYVENIKTDNKSVINKPGGINDTQLIDKNCGSQNTLSCDSISTEITQYVSKPKRMTVSENLTDDCAGIVDVVKVSKSSNINGVNKHLVTSDMVELSDYENSYEKDLINEEKCTTLKKPIRKRNKGKATICKNQRQQQETVGYDFDEILESDVPDLLSPPKRNRKELKFNSDFEINTDIKKETSPKGASTFDKPPFSYYDKKEFVDLDDSDSLPDLDLNGKFGQDPKSCVTDTTCTMNSKHTNMMENNQYERFVQHKKCTTDFDYEMKQVIGVLPHIDHHLLRQSLKEHEGNVEATICSLLDDT